MGERNEKKLLFLKKITQRNLNTKKSMTKFFKIKKKPYSGVIFAQSEFS